MIVNIQILRAFAAIIVVLVHAQDWVVKNNFSYGAYEYLTFNVRYWGNFGVDLFFVISGYIMFMINSKKHRSPVEFLINRIQRIVPIYWLLTFVLFALYLALPSLFRVSGYNLEHVVTSLFFVSHFFGYEVPAVYVGWTLEYELFFYLIFAFTLFIKTKDIYRLSLLTIVFIGAIYANWYSPIAIEFLYGGAIFIFFNHFQYLKNYKNNLFWLPLILAIGFVIYHANINQSERYIYWGIPSAIIVCSAMLIHNINNKLLIELGNASYSIYLLQVFGLPMMTKILIKLTPNMPGIYVFAIISIFSIIAGYIFYRLIETNINHLFRKKLL